MRALLVFYLTQHFLFSDAESYLIYGAYTAMVYMTPVFGGAIADRYLGARKAVAVGAVLLVLGHFGMTIEGPSAMAIGGARARFGVPEHFLSLARTDHDRRGLPQDEHGDVGRRAVRSNRSAAGRRVHHLLHGDQYRRRRGAVDLWVARSDVRVAIRFRCGWTWGCPSGWSDSCAGGRY